MNAFAEAENIETLTGKSGEVTIVLAYIYLQSVSVSSSRFSLCCFVIYLEKILGLSYRLLLFYNAQKESISLAAMNARQFTS